MRTLLAGNCVIDTLPDNLSLHQCSLPRAMLNYAGDASDGITQDVAVAVAALICSVSCFILYVFKCYLLLFDYWYYLSVYLLLLLKITISSTTTKCHKISVKN